MDNNSENFNQYLQDFTNWLESINDDFLSNNNNDIK